MGHGSVIPVPPVLVWGGGALPGEDLAKEVCGFLTNSLFLFPPETYVPTLCKNRPQVIFLMPQISKHVFRTTCIHLKCI